MHKSFNLWLILGLLAVRVTAFCQNTVIEGHLTGIPNGQYIYLASYSWGQSQVKRDSAQVHNGLFKMQLDIPDGEGDMYYISSVPIRYNGENQPDGYLKYFHRRELIYLQKGHLEITGDALGMDSATWSGDSFAQDLNSYFFMQRGNPYRRKYMQIIDDQIRGTAAPTHNGAPTKEDEALITYFVIRSNLAAVWVGKHLDSPCSPMFLLEDMRSFLSADNPQRDSLFQKLSPAAKNSRLGKTLTKWWIGHNHQ